MPASRRAREKQIRDIGACDQQDERDDRHDDENRLSIAGAHGRRPTGGSLHSHGRREIARPGASPEDRRHRRLSNLRLDRAQGFLCGRCRLPVLESRHDQQPRRRWDLEPAVAAAKQRFRADWENHVRPAADVGPEKTRRHDAHNRERDAIDRLGPANDIARAAVPPLPKRVTNDRDWPVQTAATAIVVHCERPAEHRSHAERFEVPAARVHAVHEVGASALREIETGAPSRKCERRLEQIGMVVADLLPDGIRKWRTGIDGRIRKEQHEPVGLLDRKRPQQETIDDREDGRIRPDTERKRQDHDQGDDGRRCVAFGSRSEIVHRSFPSGGVSVASRFSKFEIRPVRKGAPV